MKQWDVPPAGKLTRKLRRRLHLSCARQQALCLNSLATQREISGNDLAEAGASDFSTARERMQSLLCSFITYFLALKISVLFSSILFHVMAACTCTGSRTVLQQGPLRPGRFPVRPVVLASLMKNSQSIKEQAGPHKNISHLAAPQSAQAL